MKDELERKIMKDFDALRPNRYSYLTDNNTKEAKCSNIINQCKN